MNYYPYGMILPNSCPPTQTQETEIFNNDFQDGTYQGWYTTTSAGSIAVVNGELEVYTQTAVKDLTTTSGATYEIHL